MFFVHPTPSRCRAEDHLDGDVDPPLLCMLRSLLGMWIAYVQNSRGKMPLSYSKRVNLEG